MTGIVYFGLLLHWLVPALLWLNPLGPLLYLVVVILLGGLLGIAAWATQRLVHEAAVPAIFAFPLAWVAVEWIRSHLPGGLAFPWLGLGTSLTAYPEVVGLAEVVGTRGVSLWLVLVSALLAEAVWVGSPETGRERIRRWAGIERSAGPAPAAAPPGSRRSGGGGARSTVGILGVVAVVVAGPATWGLWRGATLPVAPVARIALVQTQVPAEAKDDPTRALDVTREQLRELGFGDGARSFGDPELLVWPETTFPFPVSSRPDVVRSVVESAAAEEDAPLLFGALESEGDSVAAEYNAAFLFRPGGDGSGELRSVYRKRFLVPVVERAPRLLPEFLPLPGRPLEAPGGRGPDGGEGRWAGSGELSAGAVGDPVVLSARSSAGGGSPPDAAPRFGVLICFESAFPGASREYRRAGVDFLVNVTNDVWFGEGTWLPSRAGAEQHAAHVVMRAVENRVGIARSANGGSTFFVDPVGRIHGRAPAGEAAVTVGTVSRSRVLTLYARTGDWIGPGSLGAVLLLLLAGTARRHFAGDRSR